jgi:hypothetical protein
MLYNKKPPRLGSRWFFVGIEIIGSEKSNSWKASIEFSKWRLKYSLLFKFVVYLEKGGYMANISDYEINDVMLESGIPIENQITQSVIDNLKKPALATLVNEELTDNIYSLCKNLLSYSKDRYESKEIAYALNINTMEFVGAAFGTERTIDIEPLIAQMDGSGCIYVVVHNHPSDSYFSPRDLNTFFGTPNMAVLIVLGNKGSVYTIEKKRVITYVEYIEIKKLVIAYRMGKINFENVISKLSQYEVVYNKF